MRPLKLKLILLYLKMAFPEIIPYTNNEGDFHRYVKEKYVNDLNAKVEKAENAKNKLDILKEVLDKSLPIEDLKKFKERALELEKEEKEKRRKSVISSRASDANDENREAQSDEVVDKGLLEVKKAYIGYAVELKLVSKLDLEEDAASIKKRTRNAYDLIERFDVIKFIPNKENKDAKALNEEILKLLSVEGEGIRSTEYEFSEHGKATIRKAIEDERKKQKEQSSQRRGSVGRSASVDTKKPLSEQIELKISESSSLSDEDEKKTKIRILDTDRVNFLIKRVAEGAKLNSSADEKWKLDFSKIKEKVDLKPLDTRIKKSQKEVSETSAKRAKIVDKNIHALDLSLPHLVGENNKLKEILTGLEGLDGLQNIINGATIAAGAADSSYEDIKSVFDGELKNENFDSFFRIKEGQLEFLPTKRDEIISNSEYSKNSEIILLEEAANAYSETIQACFSKKSQIDFESLAQSNKVAVINSLREEIKKRKKSKEDYVDIIDKIQKHKSPEDEEDLAAFFRIFKIKRESGVVSITLDKDQVLDQIVPEEVKKIENFVAHVNGNFSGSLSDKNKLIKDLKGKQVEITPSSKEKECFTAIKDIITKKNEEAQEFSKLYEGVKSVFGGELTKENFSGFFTIKDGKRLECKSESNLEKLSGLVDYANKHNVAGIYSTQERLIKVLKGEEVKLSDFYEVDNDKLKLKDEVREELAVVNNSGASNDDVEEDKFLEKDLNKYQILAKRGVPIQSILSEMKNDGIETPDPTKMSFTDDQGEKIKNDSTTEKGFRLALNLILKDYEESQRASTNSSDSELAEGDSETITEEKTPDIKSMTEFVLAIDSIEKAKSSLSDYDFIESLSQIVSSQKFRDLYDQSFNYMALSEDESYELIKTPKITAEDIEVYKKFNASYFTAAKTLVLNEKSADELQFNEKIKNQIVVDFKSKAQEEKQKTSFRNFCISQAEGTEAASFYKLLYEKLEGEESYADLLIKKAEESSEGEELKKVAKLLKDIKKIITSFDKDVKSDKEDYKDLIAEFSKEGIKDDFNFNLAAGRKEVLKSNSYKANTDFIKKIKDRNLEDIFNKISDDLKYNDPFLDCLKETKNWHKDIIQSVIKNEVSERKKSLEVALKTVDGYKEKVSTLKELKEHKTHIDKESTELVGKVKDFMAQIEFQFNQLNVDKPRKERENLYSLNRKTYEGFAHLGLTEEGFLPPQVMEVLNKHNNLGLVVGGGSGTGVGVGGGMGSGVGVEVGGSSSFQERHSTATAILSFGSRLTIEEKLARFSKDVYVNDFTIKIDDEGQNVKLTKAKDDKKYYYALFEKGVFDESSVEKKGEKNGVEGSGIFNDVSIFKANFKKCKFVNVDFSKVGDFETAKFANCTFVNCAFPKGFYLEKGAINEEKLNKQFPDSKLVIGDDVKELAGKVYKKDKDAKDAKDAREELAEQVGSINKRKEKGEDPEPSCKVVECTGIKSKITTNTR